jgi:transcriptional regulator with XRE-family HTH domain
MARAGLCFSLRDVARRAGVSPESVRRVEQGDPSVQLDTICAVAEAVGVDVVISGYPAATVSLRDAGQLTITRIICSMAHPSWQPHLEMPAGDHGEAIDLVFLGPDEIIAAEIDRRLLNFQEMHRRNVRKRDYLAARHQRPVRSVVITEDTRRNRQAVEPHLELIRRVLPAGSREVLNAVRSGEPLGRDGLVWMRPYRSRRPARGRDPVLVSVSSADSRPRDR